MNPIDELRAARPAHLGDGPVDPRTRAAELSHAMAQARQTAPERRARRGGGRRVRPAWGFGLLGAAAAATAVAVVVVTAGGTAPRPGPAQTVTSTLDATTGTPKATVELNARDVLLAAAHQAARQPDRTGKWWRTVQVGRTLFHAKDGDYTVVEQQRTESWTPSATGGEQYGITRSLGARPATPEDEEAWRAAGSPEKIPVAVPDKGGPGRELTLSTRPGKERIDHSPLVDGDKVFWLGRNVTMKDLRGLPDDPAELKRLLLSSYGGHGTESSSDPASEEEWLFAVTIGMITDMPVTPNVRAAAFRMLAELDGVKVIDQVTDAEGRTGTAVAIEQAVKMKVTDEKPSGVLQTRLVFDKETGQALARETVVVEPGGFQAGFEPGTVWNSSAVIEAGWTDTDPS
ncbi:hypothetical protein HNP84_000323 [Thermocatellispora tengchongensis]|uniref:CU044_5270 family protein n=1 Tax=Thermocatellispora tengchongensis TaxID=1073253 RepID=A0A840P3L4_9ACTN|nr:CU044_5270 family protein [Thermocatellispora tengchongensis]MBB5130635.1 hypothetical protein [Thermocatellispora tengchongensis]